MRGPYLTDKVFAYRYPLRFFGIHSLSGGCAGEDPGGIFGADAKCGARLGPMKDKCTLSSPLSSSNHHLEPIDSRRWNSDSKRIHPENRTGEPLDIWKFVGITLISGGCGRCIYHSWWWCFSAITPVDLVLIHLWRYRGAGRRCISLVVNCRRPLLFPMARSWCHKCHPSVVPLELASVRNLCKVLYQLLLCLRLNGPSSQNAMCHYSSDAVLVPVRRSSA